VNNYTSSSDAGIFQTAGGGAHYLAANCPAGIRNGGTTNIDPTLLADLRSKTTQPPDTSYVNQTIASDTTFSPRAQRDTDTPDLGYHYDPIDYIFSDSQVGANLAFEPGTVAGWQGQGMLSSSGEELDFNGTAVNPCYFVRCNAVQEADHSGDGTGLADSSGSDWPFVFAIWTRFAAVGDQAAFVAANSLYVYAYNCEFWDGLLGGDINGGLLLYGHNCLFDRSFIQFSTTENSPSCNLVLQNCTCHGGSVVMDNYSDETYATVNDSAFDGTIIEITDPYDYYNFNASHNAYFYAGPFPNDASPIIAFGGFNWQAGPLGNYYLPPNSPLIDAGSTTADQVGLSDFTTQTSQVPDTGTVDIGYHYPTLMAYPFSNQMCPNDPPGSPSSWSFDFNWYNSNPDIYGLPLSYTIVTQPIHGTLTAGGSSSQFTYTPNSCYEGQDSFTYRVSDSLLTSAPATVSITTQDSVTANPPSVETCRDTPVTFTLGGSDNCGEQLTYTVLTEPTHGNLTLIGTPPNPQYTYTPTVPSYLGMDSFTYKVSNACGDFATAAVTITISGAPAVIPSPIRSGFDQNVFQANDDNSIGPINLPFTISFFGASFSALYVNENGNITFDGPFDSSSQDGLSYDPNISLVKAAMQTGLNIIAPFWGDVDTRNSCSALVTYGTSAVDGHAAFGVDWAYVGYYDERVDKLNAFQLILIDRSDIANGDFDVEFNYDQIQWESGAASGGPNGLGGDAARVGYASTGGSGFEFNCSDINCPNTPGVFLDSNPTTGLIYNSFNSSLPGRYVFQFRNGVPLGHP
jgi:hypothetical protein